MILSTILLCGRKDQPHVCERAASVAIVVFGAAIAVHVWIGVSCAEAIVEPPSPVAASQPAASVLIVPEPDLSGAEPQVIDLIQRARDAVIADRESATTWGMFGVACDAHGLDVEAAECYRQAYQRAPGDRRWTYLLAVKMQLTGREPDQTMALFRQAAELMPEIPAVWHRIGEVYADNGRLNDAAEAYREVIRRFPSQAAAHRALGQVLLQSGDAEGAIAALRQADRLAPNDQRVHIALTQAYLRLGDQTRAEESQAASQRFGNVIRLTDPLLYQVLSTCVSSQRCRDLAEMLLADGEFARAARALEVVVQAAPNDPLARARLGIALTQLKQFDAAQEHLETALQLDPNCADAHTAMGILYLNLNQPDRAAKEFSQTLLIAPRNGVVRAMYATALGRLGLVDDSLMHFQKAAEDASLDATAEMEWAGVLERDNQIDRAMDHYRQAVLLNAKLAEAHYRMASLLERMNRTAEAIEHYRAAAAIDPQHLAAARLAELQANRSQGPP